jgi:hypothetical protein
VGVEERRGARAELGDEVLRGVPQEVLGLAGLARQARFVDYDGLAITEVQVVDQDATGEERRVGVKGIRLAEDEGL